MKWFMLLIVLSYGTVIAAQDTASPYLYYYSSALNAIVVERADGSDSRTLGEGLTPEAGDVAGPGWSPDGQWFAWYGVNYFDYGAFTVPQAAAVRVDNQARLKSLDDFASIDEMLWSPDSHYLFVRGKIGHRTSIRPTAFWVIDIATDKLLVSTDMFVFDMMYTTPLEWQLDQQQLVLYLTEEEFVMSRPVRVTLRLDGSVLKEPISAALYAEKAAYESSEIPGNQPLNSPGGRYIEDTNTGIFTDTATKRTFKLPLHSDELASWPREARWHPSEIWGLFAYDYCVLGDCARAGGVNVINVVDGTHRELSQCGFISACVDWLPANVDISRLPKGQAQSVLPAPIRYDYTEEPDLDVNRSELDPLETCDPATDKKVHILDPKTQQTIFILPIDPVPNCTDRWNPYTTGFALSHNRKLFVWRNTLFDARTGEKLAIINAYGREFAFNADDTQLSMRSFHARIVWDVQALLEAGKRMKTLAQHFQSS